MKLITESSYDVELYEDKRDKSLKIVGIFSTCEIENQNKRRYPKKILEREVNKISEKIQNRCLWGELSHPDTPSINPERISHIVESLEWKNNNVFGKARILDTPMGGITKTLVKEGRMGISSRGLGTVSEDGYVNEDFNLVTYDIVTEPSNDPSWVNGIYEAREFDVATEKKKEEEDNGITLEEARKEYKRHIWQVIEQIEKSL